MSRRVTSALPAALLAASLVFLAGCSWFRHKPAAEPAQPIMTVEPIAAARIACPGYDALIRDTPFPRDAVMRGLGAGKASVVFAVDGTKITILSVTSSAPAFGNAADDAVRTLRCAADQPARFAIAFEWRNAR